MGDVSGGDHGQVEHVADDDFLARRGEEVDR